MLTAKIFLKKHTACGIMIADLFINCHILMLTEKGLGYVYY